MASLHRMSPWEACFSMFNYFFQWQYPICCMKSLSKPASNENQWIIGTNWGFFVLKCTCLDYNLLIPSTIHILRRFWHYLQELAYNVYSEMETEWGLFCFLQQAFAFHNNVVTKVDQVWITFYCCQKIVFLFCCYLSCFILLPVLLN